MKWDGQVLMTTPLMVDGELVITRTDIAAGLPFLGLTLKDGIEVKAGDVIYVTLDLYDSASNIGGYFNGDGNYWMQWQSTTALENGYKRMVFKMTAGANGTLTSIRLDAGEDNTKNVGQFRISNISISSSMPA